MIRVLVDGVAFQRGANPGLWHAILAGLAKQPSLKLMLLDRGGAPALERVVALPFPTHPGSCGAADSLLIQQLCDRFSVNVFMSTGSTSPVTTPCALFVRSLESLLSEEPEDQAALSYAQRYVCPSREVLVRLLAEFPEMPASQAVLCSDDPRAIAAELGRTARSLWAEAQSGAYEAFFRDWRRIREIQAAVEWRAAPLDRMRIEQAPAEKDQ